jgi:hypothetical protein
MYTLTLTQDERAAFDWVGDRYATGDEVADILREYMDEDDEWSQEGDITFNLPEYAAWIIRELSEKEDSLWPCFAEELTAKMRNFCEEIV